MTKPLNQKSYGSIPHLPGSRQGRDDVGLSGGQVKIATLKARDEKDTIIVQEKLDGSNVAVCNIAGELVAITRSGHLAAASTFEQHRIFAEWVLLNPTLFDFLNPGERACGEWLAQAHGTRYILAHSPFVLFDIIRNGHEKATLNEVVQRNNSRHPMPKILATGPTTIEIADKLLGTHGHHGAIDEAEGAVWRIERNGKVDFLTKFVRHKKIDGSFLSEENPIWNWHPRKHK
jgi:hypothetical protein